MSKTMLKLMIQGVLLALLTTGTVQAATRCLPDDASLPATWTKNYPAHRIIGNLYAVGGYDGSRNGYLKTAERYDPKTNKWTAIASMGTARYDFGLTVI